MVNLKKKLLSAICSLALMATTVGSIIPVSAAADVDSVVHTRNFYTDVLNSDCYLHKEGIKSYDEKGFMAYYVYDPTAPDGNNFSYRINYAAGLAPNRYFKLNQYNTFKVEAGTQMRVEFKYKVVSRGENIDPNALIFWGNDDPAYGKGADTSVASDEWKTFSHEFVSNGADHQSIIIQDFIDLRIDDIKIAVMGEDGEYVVKKTNSVHGDDSLPGAVTELSATENDNGTVTLNYTLPENYDTKVHKVRAYQKKDGSWVQIGAAAHNQSSITAATVGGAKEYAVATVGWNLRESEYTEVKDGTKYIDNLAQRIDVYRKIASIATEEDSMDVLDELIDRFGEPPKSVKGLIDVALLRNTAAQFGFKEINQKGDSLHLIPEQLDPNLVAMLNSVLKGRCTAIASGTPCVVVKMRGSDALTCMREIMSTLQSFRSGEAMEQLKSGKK